MFGINESKKQAGKRVYTSASAVLRAAQRKLGGTVTTYDGSPVLHLVITNQAGTVDNDYLGPEAAARQASLNYFDRSEYK